MCSDETITLTPAIDIFAFGMCALETAALEITSSDSSGPISKEVIEKCIESLEDEGQRDFIRKCLIKDPAERPKARDLLFHPVLFEVPSLKLLAAHTLVNDTAATTEHMTHNYYGSSATIMATKTLAGKVAEYLSVDQEV